MDILEVGRGDFEPINQHTLNMARTHFTYWCICKALLLLGNDLSHMSAATLGIISNAKAISVNQDQLGVAGRRVSSTPPVGNWTPLYADDVMGMLAKCREGSPTQRWRFTPALNTTGKPGERTVAVWTEDSAGRKWALVPPQGQLGDHTTLVRVNSSVATAAGMPLWTVTANLSDGLVNLVGKGSNDYLGFSRDWGGSGTLHDTITTPATLI